MLGDGFEAYLENIKIGLSKTVAHLFIKQFFFI